MIRVVCPSCEKILGLPQATVGAVGVCPACGQRFRVPAPTPEVPEPEPEPPGTPPVSHAALPTPPQGYYSPTLPADPSAPDYGRDAPTARRRRRRRFSGSSRGQLAQTGRSLAILLACIIGAIEVLNLIISVAHQVTVEEVVGAELQQMDPGEVKEMRKDMQMDHIKGIGKAVASLVIIGGIAAALAAGQNWARITLVVLLFLNTAVALCCGSVIIAFGPFAGVNLKAFLPELVLLGLVVAVYPTVAITLLASSSIKAYCDA